MKRDEIDAMMSEIIDDVVENDRPMNVHLFEAKQMADVLRMADDGDELSRRIVTAFTQWGEYASSEGASCYGCEQKVKPNTVAAVGYLEPIDKKIQTGAVIGIVAVLCSKCRSKLSYNEAMQRLITSLEREFNCSADIYHIQ